MTTPMEPNQDPAVIKGFGAEWSRLDQSALDDAELRGMFGQYFKLFRWDLLPKDAVGFDLGCGSGRWARLVAPKVGRLHLIDASAEALAVAKRNLATQPNCKFHLASVENLPVADGSMDFGYSLGVLHHVPDTAAGIRSAAAKLRPGAPLLLYLYYSLDERPWWYRGLWGISDMGRRLISRLPDPARYAATQAIAAGVYLPLARAALAAEKLGLDPELFPLSGYRRRSFYCMRTDALDRFGTRLEQRFSKPEIQAMMEAAGLERIEFGDSFPYWCAIGFKKVDAPSPQGASPGGASLGRRRKILYLVTEDWYFCSHRLPLARAALKKGYEVTVATHVDKHRETIEREGFKLVPIGLRRSGRNPFREMAAVQELTRLYRTEKPDIVHHVAAKPVLYGCTAARNAGVPAVVNAMAGLGYAFIGNGWKAAGLRAFLTRGYRWALSRRNSLTIFQNQDDIELFVGAGMVERRRTRLIKGSGVDLALFKPAPEPAIDPRKGPVVVLASRLLWDKGVGEFVAAGRILRSAGVQARLVLVGDADPDNPAAIPKEQLARWKEDGTVEWRGFQEDMPRVWAGCHIACLPSYREGLPKSLLEAAACGRPIVAADVPGCREIARHGENGLLVRARDPEDLATALRTLIEDPERRRRFGERGRMIVQAEFSLEQVVEKTLGLYEELLGKPAGAAPAAGAPPFRLVILTRKGRCASARTVLESLLSCGIPVSAVVAEPWQNLVFAKGLAAGFLAQLKRHGWAAVWKRALTHLAPRQPPESLEDFCRSRDVAYHEVNDHNGEDCARLLNSLRPDLLITANTRILSSGILRIPLKGGLNIHKSLLPAYAGLDSIFWALYHGEKEIGVSVHRLAEGIDTGDIMGQTAIPVLPGDGLESLDRKADAEAGRLMARVVSGLRDGTAVGVPQDPSKRTYFTWPTPKQRSELPPRSGNQSGTNTLIINADDLGLDESVNEAVFHCFDQGVITSTTLLAGGGAFSHAVEGALMRPGLGVGLHFNLTMGKPLRAREDIPSLVDEDGKFLSRSSLAWRAVRGKLRSGEVAAELEAQYRRLTDSGLKPTHIDSHQHCHVLAGVWKAVAEFARKKGLPVRCPKPGSLIVRRSGSFRHRALQGVLSMLTAWHWPMHSRDLVFNDSFTSVFDLVPVPTPIAPSDYAELLRPGRLSGTVELMVHPVIDAARLEGLIRIGSVGQDEYRALLETDFHQLARTGGYTLGHFGRLKC